MLLLCSFCITCRTFFAEKYISNWLKVDKKAQQIRNITYFEDFYSYSQPIDLKFCEWMKDILNMFIVEKSQNFILVAQEMRNILNLAFSIELPH